MEIKKLIILNWELILFELIIIMLVTLSINDAISAQTHLIVLLVSTVVYYGNFFKKSQLRRKDNE